ncbi:E3 ubiquitin-protein ligase TRIM9 [Halotydeus destructor]|nr:E3 ubiquitin-protein ligase TRIM9 [Halotydeus destructor]
MEEELKCPFCKKMFEEPVLLSCGHCFCVKCALTLQETAGNIRSTVSATSGLASGTSFPSPLGIMGHLHNNHNHNHSHNLSQLESVTNLTAMADTNNCSSCNSNGPSSSASSETSDPDKLSLLSETDSGVSGISGLSGSNSRPCSYVGTPNIQQVLFPALQVDTSLISFTITCPVCSKQVHMDSDGAHSLPRCRTIEHIIDRYFESKNIVHCQLCEGQPVKATVQCEQCQILYCESCRDRCHPARGPLAKHTLVKPGSGRLNRQSTLMMASMCESGPKCADHGSLLTSLCLVCKVAICNSCVAEKVHDNHEVHSLNVLCKTQKTELSQRLQSLSEKAKSATEFIQGLQGLKDVIGENCARFEEEVSTQCDMLISAILERKSELLAFIAKEKDFKVKTLKEQVSQCKDKLQQTTGLLQFCVEALKENDASSFLQLGSILIQRSSGVEHSWTKELNATPWVSKEFELTLDSMPLENAIQQLSFKENKLSWFAFDPSTSSPDIGFTNNNLTVACQTFENRLAMTNLPLTGGVHYWEYTVDKYDGNADPAFGIAKHGASKEKMLGKDDSGWSMYIDDKRSWFLSGDCHEQRVDGGIETGSVVGVLLDLDQGHLVFYVNDERQGPVAFTDLHGPYYPAVSVNRNVQVTVHLGLEPPQRRT